MKTNGQQPQQTPWQKLAALNRYYNTGDSSDLRAPLGFSTRIAALAIQKRREHPLLSLLPRFALRTLAVTSIIMVVTVAANLGSTLKALDSSNDTPRLDDPVGDYLDLQKNN